MFPFPQVLYFYAKPETIFLGFLHEGLSMDRPSFFAPHYALARSNHTQNETHPL
jgi:hypothetical protein